jgi:hypothetical protein
MGRSTVLSLPLQLVFPGHGNVFGFVLCFGSVWSSKIFAVAIDTTISCSLGRQYRPLFRLFFLDVYESKTNNILMLKAHLQVSPISH